MIWVTHGMIRPLGIFCLCLLISGCMGLDRGTQRVPVTSPVKNEYQGNYSGMEAGDSVEVSEEATPENDPQTKGAAAVQTQQPSPDNGPELSGSGADENLRFKRAVKQLETPVGASATRSLPLPGEITLNFDNADLNEVIRTMADVLEFNYMVDSSVKGSVTIHTSGPIDSKELFPIFFQILEMNGLTAVQDGELYKIIQKEAVVKAPVLTRYGRDGSPVPENQRMVMQIIPLRYVSVSDLQETITPFLSDSGTIVPSKLDDILLVVDKAPQLKRILQMVDLFDIDVFDKFKYHFFRLEYTEVQEVEEVLKTLMSPFVEEAQKKWELVAIKRLNTLVAVSPDQKMIDRIGRFIKKIDVADSTGSSKLFVYKVKNSKAEELAALLQQLFTKEETAFRKKTEQTALGKISDSEVAKEKKESTPPPMFVDVGAKKKSKAVSLSDGIGSAASLEGDIKIVADSVRNILIFDVSPADYRSILKVLKEIDILPRQVLINVLVVDIKLTDNMSLGLNWEFTRKTNALNDTTGLLSGIMNKDGLNFSLGLSKNWTATLSAMASNDNADILSSPSVLASDNESATINVSDQIPIKTSSYDSDNGVQTSTVQYRDTGIILTVTPRISDHGMVTMELRQEVSKPVESSAGAEHPSFTTRNVDTTLTVRDGQTIVIGGLISDDVTDTDVGVPILKDIPLIGSLFKQDTKNSTKKELAIFITPRVIRQPSEAEQISREFLGKMKQMITNERVKNIYQ